MNMKKLTSKERYCGNCYHHCVYRYPEKTFCMFRFLKREDPVVSTLGVCENWRVDYEKCFCVQDALDKCRDKF